MPDEEYKKFREHMKKYKDEEAGLSAQADNDYNNYKILLELWKSENPIKTNKLQVLLVVNGLLISAMQVAGGFVPENWALYLAGAVFSIVWVLSIGRTSLYQQYWSKKIEILSTAHPEDNRFKILDIDETTKNNSPWLLKNLGGVSSKYYLLGAPVVFSVLWVLALIFTYNQLDNTQKAMMDTAFSCPSEMEIKIDRTEKAGYFRYCVTVAQGKREEWRDGYKQVEGFYENGKKHGVWKWFNSDGDITSKIEYIKGEKK